MRFLLVLLILFNPINTFAGVSGSFFCKEKEENMAGFKAELILSLDQDLLATKKMNEDGTYSVIYEQNFFERNTGYAISISAYEQGHLSNFFDGATLTTHYTRKDYSFTTSYNCKKT